MGENMGVYFYITSAIVSFWMIVVTGIMMFSEEDAAIFKAFGDTEIFFCLGVSIVLLALGLIIDKRED